MSSHISIKWLSISILLLWISNIGTIAAQSVACGGPPLLGTNGPEICVTVMETAGSGASVNFRAPAGPGAPALVIPGLVVGEYTVFMVVSNISTATGMSLTMTGTVTRTGTGSAGLSITADAGWGTPLPAASGILSLTGNSTGTSKTQVGGAAGFPVGTTPQEDLRYVGFPRIIEETTNGAGSFSNTLPPQNVNSGAVAIHMQTTFHLNNVGDSTTIPSGVGLAPVGNEPPWPDDNKKMVGVKPHFECYDIKEHYPQNQRRVVKLEDQFENIKAPIGKITRICTPVNKNDEGMPDPTLHLVCYEILKGHDPNQPVQTINQFGRTTMDVRKARELCVPSKKKLIKEEERKQEKMK